MILNKNVLHFYLFLLFQLLMLYSAFVLLLLSKHYLDEGFFTRLIVDEQFCLEKKFVAEYVEMQVSDEEYIKAIESITEKDRKILKDVLETLKGD